MFWDMSILCSIYSTELHFSHFLDTNTKIEKLHNEEGRIA